MAFWGIEVQPEKPYTHLFDIEKGRLHLSQATLGNGSSTKKSILQCKIGKNKPIYLCSLLPEIFESCALNLEFEEEDKVIFSVQGPQSIYISGFFTGESEESIKDAMRDAYESDSYGEEISGTESDDSSDYDSEGGFEGDFLDDDMDMYPSSHAPKSAVVIEEIVDDDKPATDNGSSKNGKKKKQLNLSANNNSEKQLVIKGSIGNQTQSEDEDGFPIVSNDKKKNDSLNIREKSDESTKKKEKDPGSLKRKIDDMVEDKEEKREIESHMKEEDKKKKKKNKNSKIEEAVQLGDEGHQKPLSEKTIDANSVGKEKNKKKKNKKQENEAVETVDEPVTNKKETLQEKIKDKCTQVRTFPNGLVIEEVAMGKPNGKKASPGKKVSVHYIGKLKKNGSIFDSNVRGAPFNFRLGIGEVIKGWDVGVNGMRVGDKRRLTIPPAMGYGAKGCGKEIPPNSWLVFDVELVAVK